VPTRDPRPMATAGSPARAEIISSVPASVLFQEKRSSRERASLGVVVRLFFRFANYGQPRENVSRPFVRGRLLSMDLRISEICETAARLVGASNGTLLRPINSVRFVEGRKQRRETLVEMQQDLPCYSAETASRVNRRYSLFDLLERSV
jgi:hypothetical protein